MSTSEVFISYAWGGESEKMADEMYASLTQHGFAVIRDKIHLGYKGNIKDFMQRIGRGSAIVVIISDKYLRSPNCMYEIVQIQQNGQLIDRIFPIVLPDANIYRPQQRLMYVEHWEKEVRTLNSSMKGIENMALIGEIQQELQEYNQILNAVSSITTLFKNTNTLTPDMLRDVAYKPLVDTLQMQLETDTHTTPKQDSKTTHNTLNVENSNGGIFVQGVSGSNVNISLNNAINEPNKLSNVQAVDKDKLLGFLRNNRLKEVFLELAKIKLVQLDENILFLVEAEWKQLQQDVLMGLLTYAEQTQRTNIIRSKLITMIQAL